MRQWLIRTGVMVVMFTCVYGAHELIHGGHGYIGGALAGGAFVIGEALIRRPE